MNRLFRMFGKTEEDRRFVGLCAAMLAALTSVPAVCALWTAYRGGMEWTGRTQLSAGDTAIYLSSIAQAARGKFFLSNLATTENVVAVPNVVWTAAGLIARWTGLAPLGAYHVLRLLLIPVFAATAWAVLSHFVRDTRARRIAFLLFLFGSGSGALLVPFLHAPVAGPGSFGWPTDLWVSESNAFLSAYYSPHFLASWTLLLASLWQLSVAFDRKSARRAAYAGALALLLASFHPFYVPTLCVIAAAWACAFLLRGDAKPRTLLACLIAFGAMQAPAVGYYLWLAKFTANGAFMLGANLLWTPQPLFVLAGFAGFAVLAPFGARDALRDGDSRRRAEELVLWAVATVVLIYVPVTFQRRLLEGLEFPLAALAGVALAGFERRLRASKRYSSWYSQASGILVLAAVFLPSTFYAVAAPLQLLDDPVQRRTYFFSADESAVLAWIRTSTPATAVVLATPDDGNAVLGWGERRVYAGHWAATLDLPRKEKEVASFYGGMSPTERAAFLKENGIGYVFAGPAENALGADLHTDLGLELVFSKGDYAVYRPRQ